MVVTQFQQDIAVRFVLEKMLVLADIFMLEHTMNLDFSFQL